MINCRWICERHVHEEDGQLATELDACRMWNKEVLDEMESGQGLSDSDPCLAQAVGRPRRRMDGQLASGGGEEHAMAHSVE